MEKKKDVYLVSDDGVVMGVNEHYRKAREWLKKMSTWSERISFVLLDYPCNLTWRKMSKDELKNIRSIKENKIPLPEEKCDIYIADRFKSAKMRNGSVLTSYRSKVIYLYEEHAVYYFYLYDVLKSVHFSKPNITEIMDMFKDGEILHEIGQKYE